MSEINPYHEVVRDMVENMWKARTEAKKSRPIPFGQEKVSRAVAMKRIGAMSEGQRAALRAKIGDENLLKILRGSNGNT